LITHDGKFTLILHPATIQQYFDNDPASSRTPGPRWCLWRCQASFI